MLHAVIMAGGAGTRFWPASRANQPKQLLVLHGDRTMIQATYDRIRDLVAPQNALVVTSQSLVQPIAAQLPELPPQAILGEPCKRDTAPCIGLAAGLILLQVLDQIAIEALPADIPAKIEVDITPLTLERSITVADLPAMPGISYLDETDTDVFVLNITREEVEEEPVETEEAEPEVVGRDREDDEEEE